jgi:hypothetical protein
MKKASFEDPPFTQELANSGKKVNVAFNFMNSDKSRLKACHSEGMDLIDEIFLFRFRGAGDF